MARITSELSSFAEQDKVLRNEERHLRKLTSDLERRLQQDDEKLGDANVGGCWATRLRTCAAAGAAIPLGGAA
jgi:hypothetical protein